MIKNQRLLMERLSVLVICTWAKLERLLKVRSNQVRSQLSTYSMDIARIPLGYFIFIYSKRLAQCSHELVCSPEIHLRGVEKVAVNMDKTYVPFALVIDLSSRSLTSCFRDYKRGGRD